MFSFVLLELVYLPLFACVIPTPIVIQIPNVPLDQAEGVKGALALDQAGEASDQQVVKISVSFEVCQVSY